MSFNNNNRKQKRKQSARGRKARNNKNQNGQLYLTNHSASGNVLQLPKRLPFSDALRTVLRYIIPFQQVLGGGTTNNLRFTSNAYDVDTALGSTAMSYFSELATIYSRFRTLAIKYTFEVTNSETFPITIIYGVMTNSISSTGLGQNFAGNPYMHTKLLTQNNGCKNKMTVSGSVPIHKLFGSSQALFDDLFTGSTTSSTLSSSATANCYIGASGAAVPVAGWFVTGTIELDLVFNRRNDVIV
jgi:hypothetical protein